MTIRASSEREQPSLTLPVLLRMYLGLLAGGNRRRFAALVFVMLCATAFETLGLGLVMPFIALLQDPESATWAFIRGPLHSVGITTGNGAITVCGIVLVVLFVLKNVFLAVSQALQLRFVFSRMVMVSTQLLTYYLYRPYTFHLQSNSADAIRKLVSDTTMVFSSAIPNLLTVLVEALTLGVMGGLLVALEPVAIPIAALVVALGAVATQRFLSRRVMQLGMRASDRRTGMIRWANEALGGIKEILVARVQPFFLDRFNEDLVANAEATRKYRSVALFPRHLLETFGVAGLVLVAIVALQRGYAAANLIPLLGLLAVAVVRLLPGVARIMISLTDLRYCAPAARALAENLRELRRLGGAARGSARTASIELEQAIELRGVSYTYPGAARPSLEDVSLSIPAGLAVALVGVSGAGKTTLADVVIGLLEPDRGTLSVDGKPLTTEDKAAWSNLIGYIPQHVYLCDDTLRRNIAFGVPDSDVDTERLDKAIKGAQLEALMAELPAGAGTYIGERGVRLSGGQRQRIGIARALYRDPKVLVLDEATSALDGITEREVVAAIDRLSGERTLIVIAHRLSTVRHCQKLVLMHQGRVLAEGAWQELLEKSPEFRHLAESAELGTR